MPIEAIIPQHWWPFKAPQLKATHKKSHPFPTRAGGCARVVWMCMVVYGCAWVCMGVYGCVWVCKGVRGVGCDGRNECVGIGFDVRVWWVSGLGVCG